DRDRVALGDRGDNGLAGQPAPARALASRGRGLLGGRRSGGQRLVTHSCLGSFWVGSSASAWAAAAGACCGASSAWPSCVPLIPAIKSPSSASGVSGGR